MSTVREHGIASPPLLPVLCQVAAQTQPIHCFRKKKKKEVRKNDCFDVNKAGRDGLLKQLANCPNTEESNSK